jgi:hypothetical protein
MGCSKYFCNNIGTDRRLRNVCVDGGSLGQTGPDMLDARLSQDDPDADIGSITKHDLTEATPRPARVPSSRRAPETHYARNGDESLGVRGASLLRRALPSGSPQVALRHQNWLVKTSLRQKKARARQRFCWTEK